MKLRGCTAVITGGGSGLGQAAALLFAQEGAKVVIVDIDDRGGKETITSIQKQGGESIFVKADVSISSQVQSMVRTTFEKYGRLDILITSAGILRLAKTADLSEDDWDLQMNINLKGTFLCAKYCIPAMIQTGGGNIVTLGSAVGLHPVGKNAAYGSSKAAVTYLTKLIALEYGEVGIRANCVCPGNIDTPMLRNSIDRDEPDPEKERKAVITKTVMKRLGTAQEVAQAMLFLVSPEASYITGTTIVIDGGRLLMLSTG
jgi:NAD(P)-dependent dehydrogenase (short-subunit alcohol dehydrogenase family)